MGEPDREADDGRLYVPAWEDGWRVRIKTTWEREYCFAMKSGEDFYHLLMAGEIYMQFDDEKFCMECAMRRGVLSRNRLHWKRGES